MSYLLDSTAIRNPRNIEESTIDQYAQQKTLSGAIRRDYFGATKRIWAYDFTNTKPADYAVIKAIVDSYKSTGSTKTFEVTEANYIIAETLVHLDLVRRTFTIGGDSYISDFSLILTEA